MNILERLAHKPLSARRRRPDGLEDGNTGQAPIEIFHERLLEVWSHKGADSGIPGWLASADSLRVHLDELLSEFLEADVGAAGGVAGTSAFERGPTAPVAPLGDMLEAILALAESPPPVSPFAPIAVDIPLVAG